MALKAIFSVVLNVRNFERSRQFYEWLGFTEDVGFRLRDEVSLPRELGENLGVDFATQRHSALVSFPWEPYMHIELVEWQDSKVGGWPPAYHQIGSPAYSFLVDDIEGEVAALQKRGVEPLVPLVVVERTWGPTRTAVFRDPDGNFVHLIEINYFDDSWDASNRSVVGSPISFLHFQVNTDNWDAMSEFYEPFGFDVDTGVQSRPGTSFQDDIGGSTESWTARWPDLDPTTLGTYSLLRLPSDKSNMHMELFAVPNLHDPGATPIWNQRGVIRLCFLDEHEDERVAEMKRRGVPIIIENHRFTAHWGDSKFMYFTDPDGNILCCEQWHRPRIWGERW